MTVHDPRTIVAGHYMLPMSLDMIAHSVCRWPWWVAGYVTFISLFCFLNFAFAFFSIAFPFFIPSCNVPHSRPVPVNTAALQSHDALHCTIAVPPSTNYQISFKPQLDFAAPPPSSSVFWIPAPWLRLMKNRDLPSFSSLWSKPAVHEWSKPAMHECLWL